MHSIVEVLVVITTTTVQSCSNQGDVHSQTHLSNHASTSRRSSRTWSLPSALPGLHGYVWVGPTPDASRSCNVRPLQVESMDNTHHGGGCSCTLHPGSYEIMVRIIFTYLLAAKQQSSLIEPWFQPLYPYLVPEFMTHNSTRHRHALTGVLF